MPGRKGNTMKRDAIIATFEMLARSQGFYGRLLRSLYEADEDQREEFLQDLENQNFSDPVDLVMYIEG